MTRLAMPEGYGALFICPAGETGAAQHEAAHALLMQCVPLYASERNISVPEQLSISRSEMGKPYFPELPELYFNLSHCKGLAACLLSPHACGVDAEIRRPLREKVVRRVFSPEEQAALAVSDDPDFLFTRLWTLKESYVKAIGVGISYPMREVRFSVSGGEISSDRKDVVFWQTTEGDACISVCLLGMS